MNLADVTSLANGPILELIQWLQRQNCIADPLRCTACNIQMVLTQRNGDHVDGYFWYVRSSQFVMHILSIEISYQFCFVWWGRIFMTAKGLHFQAFSTYLLGWFTIFFVSLPPRDKGRLVAGKVQEYPPFKRPHFFFQVNCCMRYLYSTVTPTRQL